MPKGENYIFEHTNLLDLTLYQYGKEDCYPLQMFGPALRNHYLIHFVLKGEGIFQLGAQRYPVKAGQAFFIAPKIPATYYADEKNPWSYAWVEFDGLKAGEYLKRTGLCPDSPIYTPRFRDIQGTPAPSEILLHMLKHHEETSLYLISHLYLLLDSLIKYAKTEPEERPGTLKDFYMKEAVHYMEEHYQENISIQQLSDWCGLNRTYFSKLFKDSLEITPQEFLMKYRMSKACELLSKTNTAVNEVAAAVGYQNPLHFSRAFKKMYGVSPREWRGKNRI